MKLCCVSTNHWSKKFKTKIYRGLKQGAGENVKMATNASYILLFCVSCQWKLHFCEWKYDCFSLHLSQMMITRHNLAVRRYYPNSRLRTGTIGHMFVVSSENAHLCIFGIQRWFHVLKPLCITEMTHRGFVYGFKSKKPESFFRIFPRCTVVWPIPTHSPVLKYFDFISGVKQSFGKIYVWATYSNGFVSIWRVLKTGFETDK